MDLVIGNVGDSRAVLAMRDKDNSLIAIQLTVDLKPDLPSPSLSFFISSLSPLSLELISCCNTYV